MKHIYGAKSECKCNVKGKEAVPLQVMKANAG
jgi:hypothetical protein